MAFADVTALAVAYLTPIVAPTRVSSRVPGTRPAELIQVRRVGGQPVVPVRESVRLDVHTWAAGEPRAFELASTVREAMWALAGTTLLDSEFPVYQVGEFLSPRSLDDPEGTSRRVWATYELVIRATDIVHIAPSVNQ